MDIEHFSLDFNIEIEKKRDRNKTPKYNKSLCTISVIKKDNVEPHIFRYKTLYKILNLIYLQTHSHPLSNVSYYKETEDNDIFLLAEIKGTELWYIKDRIKAHIKLLKDIKRGNCLEYSDKPLSVQSDTTQLSIFEI